jgi:nitrilase
VSADVRVAVVQATPVVLDAVGSVAKACDLIGEAGAAGARIIALPEVFVALYPSSRWAHACAAFGPAPAELHRRLWANSVDVPGPLTERLGAAARRARAWVAIGVNERDSARPGTLWNTLIWLAPDGTLARRHRKLMPTLHERVFYGQGDGDDLDAIPSEHGRLGGLICWENFMPEARRRLHREGVDFYVAPTADDRDIWVAAMRTYAFEAGAFVLSPVQYLRRDHFPDDFPLPEELASCPDELLSGASLIADPWGQLLAGPVSGREEILYADCDLGQIIAARRVFDTAGHYHRPDVERALGGSPITP